MSVFVKALEWLRPLVETKAWDYCITWKFGDDPSRYIQWSGCCCNGSHGDCKNVKEENDVTKLYLHNFCKDTYIKHTLRTKACEKLAKIPSNLPLYSGIHGEVAMSNQSSWLSHESIGTQVLIPVDGGLIELFRSIHVPKDQQMIESLIAQFNIFVEHEQSALGFPDEHSKNSQNISLTSIPQAITHPKFEGSPTGSNPWSENSSLSTHVSPNRSIGKTINSSNYPSSWEIKENTKTKQKTGKEQYQSKNLVTERNRRNRIKDGLFALRALCPKISKMDRSAIVGDAVEYIKELKNNIEELQDELKKLEEEDWKSNEGEIEVCKPKRALEPSTHSPCKTHNRVSVATEKQTEIEMEAHQIGSKEFLIKLVCNQKRGGFLRLMQALSSVGLQVIDANVTTCNGKVLNILKVEAKGKEVAVKSLKDSLLRKLVVSDG